MANNGFSNKLGPQPLTPVATASAPRLASPDVSKTLKLAQSLKEFGQKVTVTTVQRTQQAAKAQEEKGRAQAAAAIAEGKNTIEALVNDGIISRGDNPFFRDGVFAMLGQARADKFGAELTVAAAEAGLQDSVSESDFDTFAADFAAKFNADNPVPDNAALSDGFAERADQYLNSMRQKHATMVASNITKKGDEALATAYRGVIINAEANVPAKVYVQNISEGLKAQSDSWLETLGRTATAQDRTKMNDALVRAVVSGIDDGTLTGEQGKDILRGIKSGTNSLFSVPRHSDAILKAAQRRASFNQSMNADQQLSLLNKQRTAESEVRQGVFEQFEKDGRVDLTSVIDQIAQADPGTFSPDFTGELVRLATNLQNAKALDYESNIDLKNSLWTDILQGGQTSMRDISRQINVGQLNPRDASFLRGQLRQIQNDNASQAPQGRMWAQAARELDMAMGGFSPSAITTRRTIDATPVLRDSFQQFITANPDATITSPEFVDWKSNALVAMQHQFMSPTERLLIEDQARQQEATFATQQYEDNTYITNTDTLAQWVAEVELEMDPQTQGSFISDGLDAFFATPGRSVSEQAASDPLTYLTGLQSQLIRNGVKINDSSFRKQVDKLKEEMLRTQEANNVRKGLGR